MSADTLAERIREIKEREAKATKGPWFWRKCYEMGSGVKKWALKSPESEANSRIISIYGGLANDYFTPKEKWNADPDNQFIAHARADIPYLLEQLEKALSELSAAEQAAKKEEREACAKIADDYHGRGTVGSPTAKVIAESIRNRE